MDYYGHLKLTDFGLARRAERSEDVNDRGRELYSFCGSPIYIAPETLQRKAYDFKVDYYALGILLFEMITGKPPFNFKKADMIKKAKLTQEVSYPLGFDPRVKIIIESLLHKDPRERIADVPFYAKKLKELGVDLEIIKKDRYTFFNNFLKKVLLQY